MELNVTCDGAPVKVWDVVDAATTVERLFVEAKANHEIPDSAQLKFIPNGPYFMATYRNGSTNADPIALGCFQPVEIQAMYKHELGHFHHQSNYALSTFNNNVQLGVIWAFMVVAAYKAVRFSLTRWRPYEWSRLRIPVFSGLVAFHTIYGFTAARDSYNEELHAEAYAVRAMHSKDPVLDMEQRIRTTNTNIEASRPATTDWEMGNLIRYGFVGMRHAYPTAREMIAYIRSMRPEEIPAAPKPPELSQQ